MANFAERALPSDAGWCILPVLLWELLLHRGGLSQTTLNRNVYVLLRSVVEWDPKDFDSLSWRMAS